MSKQTKYFIRTAARAAGKNDVTFLLDMLTECDMNKAEVARRLGITKQAVGQALNAAGIELRAGQPLTVGKSTKRGKSKVEQLAVAAGVDRVDYLRSLLEAHNGNISATAKTVGVSFTSVWQLCRAWGLTSPRKNVNTQTKTQAN